MESGANWVLRKAFGRRLCKDFQANILAAYTQQAAPSFNGSVFSPTVAGGNQASAEFFSQLSLGSIPGNAGDILITHLQKSLWEQQLGGGLNWYDAYPDIKARTNHAIIEKSRCMVVGPGGLISGAPHKNQSGWFLDIDQGLLDSTDFPIVVFGAGVNRWKNKRSFTSEALANIESFFQRCHWIGLRETAGIQFLTDELGDSVSNKLQFQPCPSLMLRELTTELPNWNSNYVSVNIAADQLVELPIGRQEVARIYDELLAHLVRRNLVPILWCASSADLKFADEFFPQYGSILLSGFPGAQIPHIVRMFRFAIGTRMHSVFPFIGLGIPAIATFGFPIRSSVMRDDLGLPEWLCDWSVSDRDWGQAAADLRQKADQVIDQIDSARKKASDTISKVTAITRQNLAEIVGQLGLNGPPNSQG